MDDTIRIRALGGFHLGGRAVTLSGLPVRSARFTPSGPLRPVDPNGTYATGQMYVHYVRLAQPSAPHPLVFWHGGGMTGVAWEDTPDGRPGWQRLFLGWGHDVFVADAVERGRASWSPWPEIYPGPPVWRTMEELWATFRFGPAGGFARDPAGRRPHPGLRFPLDALDQLLRQIVPRWTGSDPATEAAYAQLLARIGPAVVVAHSQAGGFAFRAAAAGPGRVAAVVLVEPSGAPEPATAIAAAGVPHLVLWGDNIAGDRLWEAYRATVERYLAALRAAGGRADVLDLPAEGIRGNSHLPMMDRNSAEIAARVQDWLAARGLARRA